LKKHQQEFDRVAKQRASMTDRNARSTDYD
jgi:hypothetical protein